MGLPLPGSAAIRSASAAQPASRIAFDFSQSNGAVREYRPKTGSSIVTLLRRPSRQREKIKRPLEASAAVMARPISVRGSNRKGRPPTPSRTSPS